jgi:hypothetical protein
MELDKSLNDRIKSKYRTQCQIYYHILKCVFRRHYFYNSYMTLCFDLLFTSQLFPRVSLTIEATALRIYYYKLGNV